MKAPILMLLCVAGVFSACASTPFVGEYSPEAARRQARQDFAAGAPKIYRAGGIASFEPGVSERERKLVAGFPRDNSLTGCTNPRVTYSVEFATAYNREIVALTIKRRPHEASTSGNQR